MSKKLLARGLALALAVTFVAAACGDDSGNSSSATTSGGGSSATSGGGGSAGTRAAPAKTSGLLTDNGPGKTDLPPYPVGIITVFESAVLTLIDQVTALDQSVKSFNARGGIGGHCMKLTTCDDKADVNKEVDCARQMFNG